MIEVELPDGTIAEFPDGTSPDVMKQALQKRFGAPQQATQPPVEAQEAPQASTGTDMVRSLGTGLRQGVEGLAGMFGDANAMQGDLAGWVAGKFGASPETQETARNIGRRASFFPGAPTTEQLQGASTAVVGEHYQPQTTAGEYARTVGQFAPGAALGPGTLMRKGAMTVVPALASETAGQLTEGTAAEPFARGVAALAGGVAASGRNANAVKPQPAPTADQLRAQGNALYTQAKNAGVVVKPQAIDKVAFNTGAKLRDFAFDKQLQPDTAVVVKKIIDARGKSLTLPELENIRKMAVGVTRSAAKPDDRTAAGIIIEQIDNVIDDASNFVVKDKAALDTLKSAREVWKRKAKTELLEEVVEKAKNQATGFENGLVIHMRALANNKKKMRGFSAEEQKMIRDVVRRGSAHGVLRALGMLSPNSTFGGLMTGGVGVGAGILPGAALAGTGMAARAGAGALTRGKVDRLQSAVASGVAPQSGPAPVSVEALIRSLIAAKSGENSAKTNAAVQ